MEYSYSIEDYENKGGTFTDLTFTFGGYQTIAKDCFVVIGDECRYNITANVGTHHRYYADYALTVNIETDQMDPEVTSELIYKADETYYGNAQQDDFYGFTLTDKGGAHVASNYGIVKALYEGLSKPSGIRTCSKIPEAQPNQEAKPQQAAINKAVNSTRKKGERSEAQEENKPQLSTVNRQPSTVNRLRFARTPTHHPTKRHQHRRRKESYKVLIRKHTTHSIGFPAPSEWGNLLFRPFSVKILVIIADFSRKVSDFSRFSLFLPASK